ncbi:MAG: AAA family ATPase [Rhodothermales bacterium]
MLLEKIRLRGFLSHYGIDTGADIEPVELDFCDAPLWLVHGENGSGKSAAVFDAVSFALYKQHRGGKSNFGNLIHQEADFALVEVQFLLENQRYLIQREIKRRGDGATTHDRLFVENQGTWKEKLLDGQKVEQWVTEQLRMPYDTFVATVLLRQGNADAFLEAKAKDRRELLLQLINLKAYQRLGELATRKKNGAESDRKRWDMQLADVADVTEDTLKAARATVTKQKGGVEKLSKQIGQMRDTQAQAARAKALATQIATLQKEVKEHQELLAKSKTIEEEARRYYELDAIIPKLQRLQDARGILTFASSQAQSHREQVMKHEAALTERAEQLAVANEVLSKASTARENAEAAERELGDTIVRARQQGETLRKQLEEHQMLDGTSSCPTCGADVSTPESRERVTAHYQQIDEHLKEQQAHVSGLDEKHATAKTLLQNATTSLKNAEKAHGDAEKAIQNVRTLLKQEEISIKKAEGTIHEATAQVTKRQEELPGKWRTHKATEDDDALRELDEERASLIEAPARADTLRDARNASGKIQGQLQTLETQRDQIPKAVREIDPDQLQAELDKLEGKHKTCEEALAEAQTDVGRIEEQLEQRKQLIEYHDKAERTRDLYKKLANAFGPQGLQALILRDAQVRVRIAANDTLQRLSGGTWEIELQEDSEELHILAKDNSQPNPDHALRAFEYLSGGERFRVAIALAVGIGQSVTGGRTADSLLIDEGFGALDDDGRALMIEELHRLSEDVLGGGRVIVVSHQEDVQDQFLHRYLISKHGGRTQVDRMTPQDEAVLA